MKIYVTRTYTDIDIVTLDKEKALEQFTEYRFFDVWENDVLIMSVSFDDKEKYTKCPYCENEKDIEAKYCDECASEDVQ